MLCPLKFNAFPFEENADPMGMEKFNAVSQCEKSKCQWWITKSEIAKDTEDREYSRIIGSCAIKLIAKK